jgi:hypothetical protein
MTSTRDCHASILRNIADDAEAGKIAIGSWVALRDCADEIERLRMVFRINMIHLAPTVTDTEIEDILNLNK